MAKRLNFEYDGKEYCLEFTRSTVREMERKGFVASDLSDKPLSTLPELFAGAFKAHHPTERKAVIDEIYNLMPDKQGLISCLAEMYSEPINALLDEPEGNQGNVIKWTPNFQPTKEE